MRREGGLWGSISICLVSLGDSLELGSLMLSRATRWVQSGSVGLGTYCGLCVAYIIRLVPFTFFLALDLRNGALWTQNRCGQQHGLAKRLFKVTHAQLLKLLLNTRTLCFSALHFFLGWVRKRQWQRAVTQVMTETRPYSSENAIVLLRYVSWAPDLYSVCL